MAQNQILDLNSGNSIPVQRLENLNPGAEDFIPELSSNVSEAQLPRDLIQGLISNPETSETSLLDALGELEAQIQPVEPLQTPKAERLSLGLLNNQLVESLSVDNPEAFGVQLEPIALVTQFFEGTDGPDLIVGTNDPDIIFARAGNDIVIALNGNDQAFGEDGNDILIGGGGSDFLDGGSGNDRIFGDFVRFGSGGDDDIFAGDGDDTVRSGIGNDRVFGDLGNDVIFGEDGDDFLNADAGDDVVDGGAGIDVVFGSLGNDSLFGGAGDDQVTGGPGNDSLSGEEGNDTLIGVDPFIQELGFGRGEIDTLTGAQDSDIFVLGNVQEDGSKAVFYDDGNHYTTGTGDYALITDFEFTGVDQIQLAGSLGSYSLGSSPDSLPSGTGIFFGEGVAGSVPELIGIVQNVALSNLNLANSNQFTFV